MRIRTLLNRCHKLKSFVYVKEQLEVINGQEALVVDVVPRKNGKTICSGCGKDSEVPFSPKPDKPVYCKECFPKHRASKNVTKPSTDDSQKTTNTASSDMLKQFENWQKMMSESYLQSMKAYSEMMNKFAETWKKMPQN